MMRPFCCPCGWVDAKDIAFCASKEEWLDMWQVDLNGKDFLVVTGKQIFGSVFFDLVAMKKNFPKSINQIRLFRTFNI